MNRLWTSIAACGCLIATTGVVQAGDDPSADDIIKALTPKHALRNGPGFRSLRGVEVSEPTAPASIDLYISFKYDSAELSPESMVVLKSLGAALSSNELTNSKMEIVGHTDAKGSDPYNMSLSKMRATAVRNFLVSVFNIDGDRLKTTGLGESALKDSSRPLDAINRRVEIRNVGSSE